MDMYKRATKEKWRFETSHGMLPVEALWKMPLKSNDGFCLDELAKTLHKQTLNSSQSFVEDETPADEVPKAKFDLVLDIIKDKLNEKEQRMRARENAKKKQQIMALIHEKEFESFKDKSIEELTKMIDEL